MSIFTGAGVAIVTPFNEDESINYDKLDQLIDYHCNNGTDSIIICGTTGESATMSEKEHMECVKFAIERTKGRLPIIIMYSVASRTGCNIEPATAARLIKEVDNIVGIKEASGNISQVAKIMHLTDGKADLYSGNDDQIVPILSLGGKGVISVLSNVAPQETHDICAKFFEGDVKGSLELQLKAIPLIEQLFCEVNPIPVKKAMKLMGMDCGPLRMPLTELTPQHEESLAKAMIEFGIKLA